MTNTGRRALVTGATGFVGSRLVRHLVHEGWSVAILARTSASLGQLADVRERIRIHHYTGALSEVGMALEQARPATVFHVAALFVGDHEPKHVEPLVQSNVLFGAQLLEAMHGAGVTRIVNTGTAWQYGDDDRYSPANLYAATKQAFDDILGYYAKAHRYSAITLALYDTYGPDDPRGKLFSRLIEASASGSSIAMSPGGQRLNLVYVDDAVRAYTVAASLLDAAPPAAVRTFAVRSPESYTLKEIVERFEATSGKSLAVKWSALPYRRCEVMQPWSGGEALPGWRASVTLEEGLRRILARSRAGHSS